MYVSLLTQKDREQLLQNGIKQHEAERRDEVFDFHPVVKLFAPDAACVWLLTEVYPRDPNIAFGLCDLGVGFPELGDVSLTEIKALRGPLGLKVERDQHFTAAKTLSEYAKDAYAARRITA